MDEPSARLWLNQAHSDFDAATRSLDLKDHGSFCQAIAKHQQVVEKSVKAVAAALGPAGFRFIRIGYSHKLQAIISLLFHLPTGKDGSGIVAQIRNLLSDHDRAEIVALSSLAPAMPPPGRLASKNTEYPFQKPDGSWVAPCDDGAFSSREVERFSTLSARVIVRSGKIVSALELAARRLS